MMAKKILSNQGKPAMVQQPASFLQVANKMIPGSLLDKKSPFYTRQLAAANFLRNFDPDSWVPLFDPDDFNNHVSQLGHGNLTGEAAGRQIWHRSDTRAAKAPFGFNPSTNPNPEDEIWRAQRVAAWKAAPAACGLFARAKTTGGGEGSSPAAASSAASAPLVGAAARRAYAVG